MAASPNPLQGSLFGESKQSKVNESEQTNTSKTSNENLSHQQLQRDAH